MLRRKARRRLGAEDAGGEPVRLSGMGRGPRHLRAGGEEHGLRDAHRLLVCEELRIAPSVEVDVLVDVDDFLGRVGRERRGESGQGRETRESGEVSTVHEEPMMKRSPADGEENGSTIASEQRGSLLVRV